MKCTWKSRSAGKCEAEATKEQLAADGSLSGLTCAMFTMRSSMST